MFPTVVFIIAFHYALFWARASGAGAMAPLSYTMLEESSMGVILGDIIKDSQMTSSSNRQTTARLLANSHSKHFVLDGPLLKTSNIKLDRDVICTRQEKCSLELDILLLRALEQRFVKVEVEVIDINDNAPQFTNSVFDLVVSESVAISTVFSLPSARDVDSPINGINRYEMTDEDGVFQLKTSLFASATSSSTSQHFNTAADELDELSLIIDRQLDYETRKLYEINITAWDIAGHRDTMTVRIRVQDENDNRPYFLNSTYFASIAENAPPLSTVIVLTAFDADDAANGRVKYSFTVATSSAYGHLFGIDENTGAVFLRTAVDYEDVRSYSLTAVARDAGTVSLTTQAKLTIYVLDVNDNAPTITVNAASMSGRLEVSENTAVGTVAAFITVADLDFGEAGLVDCALQSEGQFVMQTASFANMYSIASLQIFDREQRSRYDVVIQCTDRGSPPLRSSQNMTIAIRDENDNAPVFRTQVTAATIRENNYPDATLLTVSATDADDGINGEITYTIESRVASFVRVVPSSGRVTAIESYDREVFDAFSFYVYATDGGNPQMTSSILIMVTIDDVNDEPPTFALASYTFAIHENLEARSSVGNISAIDRDKPPYNAFRYSINDPENAFDINPLSGHITARRMLNREQKPFYHVVVVATDVAPPMLNASVNVTIFVIDRNDNPPIIIQPNETTNSMQISTHLKAGHIFLRLQAYDLDTGVNSQLTYVIEDGNGDDVFDVLPTSGEVYVKRNLWEYRKQRFHLKIRVYDSGTPSMWTRAIVHVVINESLPYIPFGDIDNINVISGNRSRGAVAPRLLLRYHEFVMVILGSVTLVVVLCLVTAILCVKRRRDKRSLYRCQCVTSDLVQRLYPDSIQSSNHSIKQRNADFIVKQNIVMSPDGVEISFKDSDSVKGAKMDRVDRLMAHRAALGSVAHCQMTSPKEFGIMDYGDESFRDSIIVDNNVSLNENFAVKSDNDSDSTSGASSMAGSNDSGRGTSLDGGVVIGGNGTRSQQPLSSLNPALPIIAEADGSLVHSKNCPSFSVQQRHFTLPGNWYGNGRRSGDDLAENNLNAVPHSNNYHQQPPHVHHSRQLPSGPTCQTNLPMHMHMLSPGTKQPEMGNSSGRQTLPSFQSPYQHVAKKPEHKQISFADDVACSRSMTIAQSPTGKSAKLPCSPVTPTQIEDSCRSVTVPRASSTISSSSSSHRGGSGDLQSRRVTSSEDGDGNKSISQRQLHHQQQHHEPQSSLKTNLSPTSSVSSSISSSRGSRSSVLLSPYSRHDSNADEIVPQQQ